MTLEITFWRKAGRIWFLRTSRTHSEVDRGLAAATAGRAGAGTRRLAIAVTPYLVPELICSDIERSLKFYTEVLGFTVLFARPEERFAYLEREGAQLMIEQSVGRAFVAGELLYPYGRAISLQIRTDDVDALYVRVQSAKANVYLPTEEKWYRRDDVLDGNRQFVVQDPDGYLLRFSQDLGSKPVPS